ncbi:Retinol dehydrogenase 12 [Colletotrichum higginsianum IMI 349063]|uniref:Retinol dehydrogenase 12 n=2 Tax=Colletotrichum higginsianum TaxID=80884 RepID=A0A1B7Y1C7_COLHI|nr:Retinol dehydrogenase 12 [Colletotrichum higginsianum IMI 349063]OBR05810.1 Retinol dehydrogenase 12 [Colletotrichum higginsianum IMI 349063]TIC90587.1 Sterol uptake control protein 2 [Colletotrichum higginsianum]GJD03911.1 retinol dehydrogenase 12 [Colletotrichum higginsianum]
MVSSDDISLVRDSNSDQHEAVPGMSSSEALESGNKHRRPHRKSRLGCQPCKKRKIKCDEARPSCLNCVRREVDCSFPLESVVHQDPATGVCGCRYSGCRPGASQHSSASSSTEPLARAQSGPDRVPGDLRSLLEEQSTKMDIMSRRLSSMESAMAQLTQTGLYQPALSYSDAALLSHFFTNTVPTMIVDDGGGGGRDFWHVRLPDLSSRHPHVLHLLLALAALHKSRSCPQHQFAHLLEQAERHQLLGIQGTTPLLGNIDDDHYEVAYTSAVLIGLVNLAMGPRQGEYVAFSDHGAANFLGLLRGVRSIKSHHDQRAPPPEIPPPCTWTASRIRVAELGFQAGGHYGEHLQRLRHLVEEIADDGLRGSYVAAMDDLEQFFVCMDGPDVATYYMSPFGWLYRISDSFLGRIQDKEPLALAMLSCFTVVLKGLESGWAADGWADHIMSGIWIYLAPEYRDMVRWPMQRLGWEPGEEDVPLRVALASTPLTTHT